MIRITSLFCLVITLLLCSCDKENDEPASSSSETIAKSNSCIPENSLNTMDSVGIMHNMHLTTIHSVSPIRSRKDINHVLNVSDSILLDYYGNSIQTVLLDSSDIAEFLVEADKDMMYSYVGTLGLNSASTTFLRDLYDLLDSYDGSNYCDIVKDIKDLESALISNNPAGDIKEALASSSIARHSLHYWDSNNFFGMVDPKGLNINWRRVFIVVCDVAGGTSGALAGTPTVVGIVAGAVAGGVGASAGGAALWDAW